jgi:hypothetical protein
MASIFLSCVSHQTEMNAARHGCSAQMPLLRSTPNHVDLFHDAESGRSVSKAGERVCQNAAPQGAVNACKDRIFEKLVVLEKIIFLQAQLPRPIAVRSLDQRPLGWTSKLSWFEKNIPAWLAVFLFPY